MIASLLCLLRHRKINVEIKDKSFWKSTIRNGIVAPYEPYLPSSRLSLTCRILILFVQAKVFLPLELDPHMPMRPIQCHLMAIPFFSLQRSLLHARHKLYDKLYSYSGCLCHVKVYYLTFKAFKYVVAE